MHSSILQVSGDLLVMDSIACWKVACCQSCILEIGLCGKVMHFNLPFYMYTVEKLYCNLVALLQVQI